MHYPKWLFPLFPACLWLFPSTRIYGFHSLLFVPPKKKKKKHLWRGISTEFLTIALTPVCRNTDKQYAFQKGILSSWATTAVTFGMPPHVFWSCNQLCLYLCGKWLPSVFSLMLQLGEGRGRVSLISVILYTVGQRFAMEQLVYSSHSYSPLTSHPSFLMKR